jgi:drug/metabolite transporter (DMT)-like permease
MYGVLSKVVAESLLSLYPVFVKFIPVSLPLQMWSRFCSYILISFLFIDYSYVAKKLISPMGMLLSIVTIVHIYSSYRGFLLLKSGVSYTMFYMYPVLILLMSGYTIPYILAITCLGVWLLATTSQLDSYPYEGVTMISLAALTEAIIYFIIKRLPTKNSWNHVFLSYFAGAVLFTAYLRPSIEIKSQLTLSMAINGILGLGGYLLRFYSMSNLPVFTYALLSNLGIIMSYIYGYVWFGETINVQQLVGTICIIIACIYAKK